MASPQARWDARMRLITLRRWGGVGDARRARPELKVAVPVGGVLEDALG